MDNKNYRTPGQLIEELLKERGWTQRLLAIILNVDETGMNKIVAGKRPVTAEMALLLSEIFNIPAEDFLELQKQYDLGKARLVSRPDPGRATRAAIFGELPISEMIKRGWIEADSIRNVPQVESALMKFFHADSVEEIEILPHAAKKTDTNSPATSAQIAWIYRVSEIAQEMIVAQYSHKNVRNAIGRLSDLLYAKEEVRKVPRILAESGIRFVVVETLTSTKIDGACFWLNENSPVIGMSLRYDRIDNFWFVLRHELEHVLQKHGQTSVMIDAELEGERAGTGSSVLDEERIANESATNFCVPMKKINSFIARKSPYFKERDVLGLANTLKIHPGLVVGQIQHITGRYNIFRQHLERVRHIVMPSAIVDGWGNIAPVGY